MTEIKCAGAEHMWANAGAEHTNVGATASKETFSSSDVENEGHQGSSLVLERMH